MSTKQQKKSDLNTNSETSVCVLEEPGSWFFTGGIAVGVFSLDRASQAGLCVL